MISVSGVQKIYLFRQPTDMRKSFAGLSKIVLESFPDQLLSGAFFVFINRRRHMTKILYWDSDGLAVWNKRLERGNFRLPVGNEGQIHLDRRQFMALIEGVIAEKFTPRYKVESERERRRVFIEKQAQDPSF